MRSSGAGIPRTFGRKGDEEIALAISRDDQRTKNGHKNARVEENKSMAKRRDQHTYYVRVNPRIEAEVEARKDGAAMSANRVLERDLARHYYMIRVARAEANSMLSPEEAALIADAMNGILTESHSIALLPHNIRDAISLEELDAKWEVDGEALLSKLEVMPLLTLAAIVDAAERFWAAVSRGEDRDPREMLRV